MNQTIFITRRLLMNSRFVIQPIVQITLVLFSFYDTTNILLILSVNPLYYKDIAIKMTSATTGLVFVTLTLFAYSDSSSGSTLVPKDIIEVIKNFELCDVKCNGKTCECCQQVGAPFNVEVCGTSSLTIADKKLDLNLKMDGETKINTTLKLDRLLNICIPVKTKGGKLGICIITSLADDISNPSAVDICINVDVSVDGVLFARAAFNCAKFDGDIQIEGETSKGLKTYGSVKVINGEQLARFVQKLVLGK